VKILKAEVVGAATIGHRIFVKETMSARAIRAANTITNADDKQRATPLRISNLRLLTKETGMTLSWLLSAVALFVGALITVQIGSNARLKEAFGEALPAVIVSSSLGVILLVAVTLSARTAWPSLPNVAGAPWWSWLGGALGAVYAVATVLLARKLGAATLTALVVTGQLICSVVLDHFGWVGFTQQAAGMGRIVGCLLMVAGFFLIARF
jgi:transporter family-2 protein